MKLEYPLDDNLPNINHARERLLARIFHYRNDRVASESTTDEDYALLYAYSKLFSRTPFYVSIVNMHVYSVGDRPAFHRDHGHHGRNRQLVWRAE